MSWAAEVSQLPRLGMVETPLILNALMKEVVPLVFKISVAEMFKLVHP